MSRGVALRAWQSRHLARLFQVGLDQGRGHPVPNEPADLLVVAEAGSLGAKEQPDAGRQWQQDRQQEEHEGPGAGGSRRGDLLVQGVEGPCE